MVVCPLAPSSLTAPCRLSLFPTLPHGYFFLFPFKILTPPYPLFMATKQENVGYLWALCLKKGGGKKLLFWHINLYLQLKINRGNKTLM